MPRTYRRNFGCRESRRAQQALPCGRLSTGAIEGNRGTSSLSFRWRLPKNDRQFYLLVSSEDGERYLVPGFHMIDLRSKFGNRINRLVLKVEENIAPNRICTESEDHLPGRRPESGKCCRASPVDAFHHESLIGRNAVPACQSRWISFHRKDSPDSHPGPPNIPMGNEVTHYPRDRVYRNGKSDTDAAMGRRGNLCIDADDFAGAVQQRAT